MNNKNKRKKINTLHTLLENSNSRGMDVDDPRVTYARREIIHSNTFLNSIYREWYGLIKGNLPVINGEILELGSGAGFFNEVLADAITSEVFYCPFVDMIADGRFLPFQNNSLRSIVMTDVFHHIPDVHKFLEDAQRTLKDGGRILMVEPWVSLWSQWVMDHFHSEPMDGEMKNWQFPTTGPLSGSNQALPWIVFERDREVFERDFPDLQVIEIRRFMPFRYLLSGGVSMRALAPAWSNSFLEKIEGWLDAKRWAMFAFIVIEKKR